MGTLDKKKFRKLISLYGYEGDMREFIGPLDGELIGT